MQVAIISDNKILFAETINYIIIADTSRIIIASMTDRNLYDFIYICMVLTTLHISKRVNHNRTLNHNHTMNHNRMVITIVRNRPKRSPARKLRSFACWLQLLVLQTLPGVMDMPTLFLLETKLFQKSAKVY